MSTSTENLKFEITLSGTYFGSRYPDYEILIDDTSIEIGKITAFSSTKGLPNAKPVVDESSTYQLIEFNHEMVPGEHVLKIRFFNKQPNDTFDFKDGVWHADKLLNIEKIVIDGIDLNHLMFDESLYEFDKPELIHGDTVTQTTACINLGFNGTYSIKFTIPFYIWLLERL